MDSALEHMTYVQLTETLLDRLEEPHIKNLAEKNVAFFYDRKTKQSYRIEIVVTKKEKKIVVTVIPKNLGKIKGYYFE